MASIDSKTLQLIVSLMKPAPIAPVVQPSIPVLQNYSGDHDLLTKLDTKVDNIQLDVSDLKRNKDSYVTQTQHSELEKVVTKLAEQTGKNSENITKIMTWGSIILVIVTIAQVILKFYGK